VKGIAIDVPFGLVVKGALPFAFIMLLCLVILIIFPQITLFLPGLM
jgi:TRAP-type C4-dicarboxylate transport system permease large subunit